MAIILNERPKEPERKPEPGDLMKRARELVPESEHIAWRNFDGLPGRDGHPCIQVEGNQDISGTIWLERDLERPDGFILTLKPTQGKIGRPYTLRSDPEVSGKGHTAEQYDALSVRFSEGEEVDTLLGWQNGRTVIVEGLYGEEDYESQTPDVMEFAQKCFMALESDNAQVFHSAQPHLGTAALRLAA